MAWHCAYEYFATSVETRTVFCQCCRIHRVDVPQDQYGATWAGPAVKREAFLFFVGNLSFCAKGPVHDHGSDALAETRGPGASCTFDFSGSVRLGFYGRLCNDKDVKAELSIDLQTAFSHTSTGVRQPGAAKSHRDPVSNSKIKFCWGLVSDPTNTLTNKKQQTRKVRTGRGVE